MQMPKLNRKFANSGSLKRQDGFVPATAAWDEKVGGFIIRNAKGKKLHGPFGAMHEAKSEGVVFHADGGRRAL